MTTEVETLILTLWQILCRIVTSTCREVCRFITCTRIYSISGDIVYLHSKATDAQFKYSSTTIRLAILIVLDYNNIFGPYIYIHILFKLHE